MRVLAFLTLFTLAVVAFVTNPQASEQDMATTWNFGKSIVHVALGGLGGGSGSSGGSGGDKACSQPYTLPDGSTIQIPCGSSVQVVPGPGSGAPPATKPGA